MYSIEKKIGGIVTIKKSIEVKGTINVDKKEMSKVHAGVSCGSTSGIACSTVKAAQKQEVTRTVVIVDELYA